MFRKDGQLEEYLAALHAVLPLWHTVQVPVESFVEARELSHQPGWFNARMLISGPLPQMRTLEDACRSEKTKVLNDVSAEEGDMSWLDIWEKIRLEKEEDETFESGIGFLGAIDC